MAKKGKAGIEEIKRAKIVILVDQERLKKYMTVDDLIGLEDQKLSASVKMLSLFMVDDENNYLPYDEARKIIGGISAEQLKELTPELIKQANLAVGAGPKEPAVSTTSTNTA